MLGTNTLAYLSDAEKRFITSVRGRKDLAGVLPEAGFFARRFGIREKGLDLHGYPRLRSSLSSGQCQVPILAGSGMAQAGNPYRRGRLSTVDLIKIGCFVKKENLV